MAGTSKIPPTDGCPMYLLGLGPRNGKPAMTVSNCPPQLGLFFDGTGNNMANDLVDPSGEKTPTNVAKLYHLYPAPDAGLIRAQYIPGVGTEAGKDDSDIDMGIAYSFGEKVSLALNAASEHFKTYPNAPLGILDVFGFSRGAAAARHFVNEVHKLQKTDPGYFGGPVLHVRFLGLFDTVGSVGLAGDNSQSDIQGRRFNLELHTAAVHHVYHLTARHEQREYFPLNSILTGPGQAPAAHFEEVELPGAHADIGGGYGRPPDIVYYPTASFGWTLTGVRQQRLEELKSRYEKDYYAPGIDVVLRPIDTRASAGAITTVWPEWRRDVKPQLAHRALQTMHAKAKEKGVPFENLEELTQKPPFRGRQAVDVYELPVDLQQYLARANDDALYRHYVHHSHQYRARPKPWALVNVNANTPEKNPRRAAPNGKREVFYNRPAAGYSPLDTWRRMNMGHGGYRWVRG